MSDVGFAARKLVEVETVRTQLTERRIEVVGKARACAESYDTPYAGKREIWRDLNDFEWSLYQFTSLLHMLGEVLATIRDQCGVRLSEARPIRHAVPRLIGLRHCIHHNGLVGAQVASAEGLPHPVVGIPLESVERHGSWGGGNPSFETFFHSADDLLVVRPIVENSETRYLAPVEETVAGVEERYGEDELQRVASNVEIYDRSESDG
ncbi:hypothetical protein RYH80_07695 [Halobaculum sp. MBLA0147]|uniref:hypothetical protein n=1 Tax=Halobaculum sp. MBLA0147 TaxID=3079934 RepID=UPI003525C0AA